MEWKRKSYTVGGADPTQIVEWYTDEFKITEFQGIYQLDGNVPDMEELVTELHKALEAAWEAAQELDDSNRESDYLVETAERKTGWDPNP